MMDGTSIRFPLKVFPPVYSASEDNPARRARRSAGEHSHPPSAITLRSGRRLQPRGPAKASMDSLPLELLEIILSWDVRMCRSEKNTVLRLRLVCKAFNRALTPYIFKTMQLEFSRFLRNKTPMCAAALERQGAFCNAVYIDLMVVRDEEEINRLGEVFQSIMTKVPEMTIALSSLRKYCMDENTFDEVDYRQMVASVFAVTPNMRRLKLNLPFQVVGRSSQTATLLLANTLAAIAQRDPEFSPLDTLVLDHVSDTTINTICHNPNDLANARNTFANLKHLVLSIKTQESRQAQMWVFVNHIWSLIMKATKLQTLCIVGSNTYRDRSTRQHVHSGTFNEWMMRSFPFFPANETLELGLNHLRCVELKRVDIYPHGLYKLIESIKSSLKELYLNEVFMKVFGRSQLERTSRWIGHSPTVPKLDRCIWLAQDLRNMEGLNLEVLRATQLGYTDFDPDTNSAYPNYDLTDPAKLNRSFDQRFVEAVFGIDSEMKDVPSSPTDTLHGLAHVFPPFNNEPQQQEPASSPENDMQLAYLEPARRLTFSRGTNARHSALRPSRSSNNRINKVRAKVDYDAKTYQAYRNVTSHFGTSIDGHFINHNEAALKELQKIITVAERGMAMLSADIEQAHNMAQGDLAAATAPAPTVTNAGAGGGQI